MEPQQPALSALTLPQVLSRPAQGSCSAPGQGTARCPPGEEPTGVSRAHLRHLRPQGGVRDPPVAHPPPFPPRRIQRGRAELVPPAPSRWETRPAPPTPSAGPGTGSWWQRGQRRATAGAEPACRGEPSRGTLSPSPARARGPCPDPPLPPRRFHSPGGEREPRGRCLPCAAAPRSTPGCPGGCWGRRSLCRPSARGRHRVCPLWDGAPCPAGMWQLRTPLLMTQAASASLGSNPGAGLLGKWDLIPAKLLSQADPVPSCRPTASPQPRNAGPGTGNQRDTGDPAG